MFDTYATPIAGRKINAVQQHEVAGLHTKVGRDNGHYVANRTLAVLSIVFRWAAGHYGIDNPVHGIKRFPEYARERFIQPAELVKFYAAVESEPDSTWKDSWKLLLVHRRSPRQRGRHAVARRRPGRPRVANSRVLGQGQEGYHRGAVRRCYGAASRPRNMPNELFRATASRAV